MPQLFAGVILLAAVAIVFNEAVRGWRLDAAPGVPDASRRTCSGHRGRPPEPRLCRRRGRRAGAAGHLARRSRPASFVVIVGPERLRQDLAADDAGGAAAPERRAPSCATAGRSPTPIPTRVGVVFQEASLFPWLTALDNIEFPLALRGAPREERRRRAEQMLSLVGLEGFGARYPHELSGGMKQRVSIARGLVQDPPVLLMDEPFAALDEQTRMTMGHELLRIWSQTRKTVVFITHSLTEAVYLADEVLVMSARPGRIIDRIADHPAAPAHLRDDGDRHVRPAARADLAADPQADVRPSMRRPAPATVRWVTPGRCCSCCGSSCRGTGLLPELFLPSLSKTLTVLWHRPRRVRRSPAGHALRGRARHADRLRRRHPGRRAGRRHRRAAQPAAAGLLQPLCRADRDPLSDLHRLVRHRLGIQDRLCRHLRLLPGHAVDRRRHPHHRSAISCWPRAAWAPRCRSRSRA